MKGPLSGRYWICEGLSIVGDPVAVLDVAIMENCAGTGKTLTGIATLNAAKTGMSLAYTTGAGTQGEMVMLAK